MHRMASAGYNKNAGPDSKDAMRDEGCQSTRARAPDRAEEVQQRIRLRLNALHAFTLPLADCFAPHRSESSEVTVVDR
jgi:hypothetical protein